MSRNHMLQNLITVLSLVLLLVWLQACSSSNSSDNTKQTGADSEMPLTPEQAELVGSEFVDIPSTLEAAARATQFDYTMPAATGGTTIARALLFEPSTDRPAEGYPLIVWAHGTTGIANACAPSIDFANLGRVDVIGELLHSGYAVLAPDYEGFGAAHIHPYYIRSSHANSIVSAVVAVHQLADTHLSNDWALGGHSQGGHVALAAARANIPAAYPLRAVVALAPGTNLKTISDEQFIAIDQALVEGDITSAAWRIYYMNLYGTFIAHALQLIEPDFKPASLFGSDVLNILDLAKTEDSCFQFADALAKAINSFLANNDNPLEFKGLKRNWSDDPTVAAQLQGAVMADETQPAPLYITQGDRDLQIPAPATTAFVEQQLALDTDLTYEIVEGGGHADAITLGALDWLLSKFPIQ